MAATRPSSTSPAGIDYQFSYAQADTPTAAAEQGLGTSPPGIALLQADDNRGLVSMGTGTGTAPYHAATVTFAQPRPGAPVVAVWPANATTAAAQPYVDGMTSRGFGIGFAVAPAASQPTGTYLVGYAIMT